MSDPLDRARLTALEAEHAADIVQLVREVAAMRASRDDLAGQVARLTEELQAAKLFECHTGDLLLDCERDIHEWVGFARRQMREMPNWEYTPYAPTDQGVAASEKIRARVGEWFRGRP